MQIKPNPMTEELIPKLNAFDNHFQLADFLRNSEANLLKEAEQSWKEIEQFEFQKMDVDGFFEKIRMI